MVWKRDIVYEPPDFNYSCTVSTVSLRPSNIYNLTVTSYCFDNDGRIALDFSWSPPDSFNGLPANYNVCIGTETLESDEDIPPNSSHFCVTESMSVS